MSAVILCGTPFRGYGNQPDGRTSPGRMLISSNQIRRALRANTIEIFTLQKPGRYLACLLSTHDGRTEPSSPVRHARPGTTWRSQR